MKNPFVYSWLHLNSIGAVGIFGLGTKISKAAQAILEVTIESVR